ncbi:MAG: ABC transporter ATP-binding protein [Bdellovibrionota bacterium]
MLLKVENLCIEFESVGKKTRAVDQMSFEIPKGKTIGLVGESGSGKSVTSLAIMGLVPNPPGKITGGSILFDDKDLTRLTDLEYRQYRGNRISMIFQEPMTSLNPVFTVGYQIAEVLQLHKGLAPKEAWEYSIELLNRVGIVNPSEKINSYPHELSGGQKQRVMIAMAIGCEPQLLIADEPTTALDVTIQKQVLDLLQELQEKSNMSMLFITHDLGVIRQIADDVLVMYKGKLVERGKVEELFQRPQHPYTKGLLKCRPPMNTRPWRLPTVSDFLDADGVETTPQVDTREREVLKSQSEILLQVKNLNKDFAIRGGLWGAVKQKVHAVKNVSFNVARGKTLGLVGESGSGKTTLGRSILRLVEPSAGSVYYGDTNVTELPREEMRQLRRKMQIVFQDPYASLNPRMTIQEALLEPMKIHSIGDSKSERIDRAAELMRQVGLGPEFLERYPHEFSGGQRQRICIARALTVEPEFIVCDECVSALDVSIQAQILNLLLDLQDKYGLTYIFISHDLSVVKFISDEVAVMYRGEIIEKNFSDDLYRNPQHNYTRKLLAAIPS